MSCIKYKNLTEDIVNKEIVKSDLIIDIIPYSDIIPEGVCTKLSNNCTSNVKKQIKVKCIKMCNGVGKDTEFFCQLVMVDSDNIIKILIPKDCVNFDDYKSRYFLGSYEFKIDNPRGLFSSSDIVYDLKYLDTDIDTNE